ncbi:MAG: SDR family NAD(P)-dependent oxidoreductase [Rhodospirillales bacterium]
MIKVAERVVMLSGATKGIGQAIAARLHADGYRLSLGARNPGHLDASLRADSERVISTTYDALSGREAAQAWVDATIHKFGKIDALINNAGMQIRTGFETASEGEFDAIMTVNAKAPFMLSQAAWPHLKAAGQSKVVNIVSLSGVRVKPTTSALYAMTKHATLAMSHSLRQLGWNDGIRVTAVLPGAVVTPMTTDKMDLPLDKMMAPESIADAVAYVMLQPQNASVSMLPVNSVSEQAY